MLIRQAVIWGNNLRSGSLFRDELHCGAAVGRPENSVQIRAVCEWSTRDCPFGRVANCAYRAAICKNE